MKRIVILIILALSASHMLAAPTPQELFAAGNEAYQAKDYATAARHYQSVIDQGYTSSTLLYNLGNALYRQGDYAHAILYFERARTITSKNILLQRMKKSVEECRRINSQLFFTAPYT